MAKKIKTVMINIPGHPWKKLIAVTDALVLELKEVQGTGDNTTFIYEYTSKLSTLPSFKLGTRLPITQKQLEDNIRNDIFKISC